MIKMRPKKIIYFLKRSNFGFLIFEIKKVFFGQKSRIAIQKHLFEIVRQKLRYKDVGRAKLTTYL